MIEVRTPLPGDIETIGMNCAEDFVRERFRAGTVPDLSFIIDKPYTHVAVINDKPVAAGGFIDQGHGGAIAWSLVGEVEQIHFVPLCRVFRRYIKATPYRWIEAHCIEGFAQSHRWVKCLGFEEVKGERCFTPAGKEFRVFLFRNHHDGN